MFSMHCKGTETLTSQLLLKKEWSQSNNSCNTKQTKQIEIHQSQITNHDLLNSCKYTCICTRSAKMIDGTEKPKICQNPQRNTTNCPIGPNIDQLQFSPNNIHTSSKQKVIRMTTFAVHYEKICIHLYETAINNVEIHSLEQKRGTFVHKSYFDFCIINQQSINCSIFLFLF